MLIIFKHISFICFVGHFILVSIYYTYLDIYLIVDKARHQYEHFIVHKKSKDIFQPLLTTKIIINFINHTTSKSTNTNIGKRLFNWDYEKTISESTVKKRN